MTGDWFAHVLWFGCGFTTCLVILLGVGPVMLSSCISQWEKRIPPDIVPEDEQEDARITAAEEALKEMERKADFYYGMATDK